MNDCPVPFGAYDRVVLAHGGGGRLMAELIRDRFLAVFDDPAQGHDGAELPGPARLVLTTDAFVVQPLFFPGGDLGSLAVHGAVNDLAMCGARPLYLTVSFILEEGLLLAELDRVVASMAAAARRCGVRVVTGDTKVVEKGHGDSIFVSVTGVGEALASGPIRPERVQAGDAVLLSGPVGAHGVAVMAARLGLDSPVRSDSAPVHEAVQALLEAGIELHCLRDPTRGGLAAALGEVAEAARLGIRLHEAAIRVDHEVADACELLGLDPLLVANEGCFCAWVPAAQAEAALRVLGGNAAQIGEVVDDHPGVVLLQGPFGGERVLDRPSGEQLPRIC